MYFKNGSFEQNALFVWNSENCYFFFFNRNPLYATRATLVSTEALKSRKMYNEAALQFIKLTSEVGCHIIQTLLLDTSLLIFATSECFNSRRGRSIKFRTYVQCSCTCTCMLVQKKYVQIIVYKFCLYRIQIYGVLFSWNKLLIATSIWRFLRSGSTPSTWYWRAIGTASPDRGSTPSGLTPRPCRCIRAKTGRWRR